MEIKELEEFNKNQKLKIESMNKQDKIKKVMREFKDG